MKKDMTHEVMDCCKDSNCEAKVTKPSEEEVREAVKTLIRWAGDNPEREGLIETPDRVMRAYEEFFAGYEEDPKAILGKTFEDAGGYDEMVTLTNIRIESHCEHHMIPIIGKAHIAYIPNRKVVGISKLARLVEVFSRRLQLQETLTAQIADTINEVMEPKGVAVLIEAQHECMTTRGIRKQDVAMVTTRMHGTFKTDVNARNEFMVLVNRQK